MKSKILGFVLGLLMIPMAVFGVTLADNTLVSGPVVNCMNEAGSIKTLILTAGTGASSFIIIEDGVTIMTISISSDTEKWTASQSMKSLKVNWSGAGSESGTFTCDK